MAAYKPFKLTDAPPADPGLPAPNAAPRTNLPLPLPGQQGPCESEQAIPWGPLPTSPKPFKL